MVEMNKEKGKKGGERVFEVERDGDEGGVEREGS